MEIPENPRPVSAATPSIRRVPHPPGVAARRFSRRCALLPRRKVYDGLLLDAGGTLLQLAIPVEETYASIGKKYGIDVGGNEIKQGFKRAFAAPWPEKLRYQGDGRDFWKKVVSEATGCANNNFFEEVYEVIS
ncbi:hypothetical protein KSP40_PGU000198 [Platanthera guangdongensis]|uniref:Haloacid dehalogenase-like hydrolase domain-containing protein 3 n=1 Tax=Platanthera guangdongensis TaxID=2320717 RepID=A0ABR2LXJ4_9ASPA